MGLAFHFGAPDEPAVVDAIARFRSFVGRETPGYFAIGDAGAIFSRIESLVAAGVSKFVLRPLLRGEEAVLAQTRHLIEDLLPAVAARWPKK
jgi:hypothetical protein